jgi:predicted deacylase
MRADAEMPRWPDGAPPDSPTRATVSSPGDGPIPYADLPLRSRRWFSLPVGCMADGTEPALPVLVACGASHAPRLVCVAGIHGNEPEGITALFELWDEIAPSDLSSTLVLVPAANPPAFRAGERRNPEDPLDMNRIFPGRADGTITERLAHRLFHDVVVGADFVLSLHGWGRGALVVPYTEYPRNSPVTQTSRAAARAFGLKWIEAFDWPPGMLVAVCARHGIPAIEPEIGGLEITVSEHRALYKRCTLNLMSHLGLIARTPDIPQTVRDVIRAQITAPIGGVLRHVVDLKDAIHRGEPVATITDLFGQPRAKAVSSLDGFVAALRLTGSIDPGEQVAVIFQPQEEPSGNHMTEIA